MQECSLLKRVSSSSIIDNTFKGSCLVFDEVTEKSVSEIIYQVKDKGNEALIELSQKFGDGYPELISREALKSAYEKLDDDSQSLLLRMANRIRNFAINQFQSIVSSKINVPGGTAGHDLIPIESAGCYAPGGSYPLPSSVLMTVIPASVAGVSRIIVASPRPSQIVQAAAYIAGASCLLAAGGAQAIAALAYGADYIKPVDIIVGPGNKYVTVAKKLLSHQVKIDMLAGPSECLVVADGSANISVIAADLLAQAEHDQDSRAILVSLDEKVIDLVEEQLRIQLSSLPSQKIARAAIQNSFAVCVKSLEEAIAVVDAIAPEHLELHFDSAQKYKDRFKNAGAVFVGYNSAEVFGDYGIGPNHVLPTLGQAKTSGGLSVFSFLKVRTWINITNLEDCQEVIQDSIKLARLEGLEAHSRAAEMRLINPNSTTSASLSKKMVSDNTLNNSSDIKLSFAIPKGNMEKEIFQLLDDASLNLTITTRGYRPAFALPNVDVKLLKSRNVVEMLSHGIRDIGFAGHDLISELGVKNLTCILDTELSPVKIVLAAPSQFIENGKLKDISRPYRIATEYENITRRWMDERNISFEIVKSCGATEVFPPEDADLIVDNTATGSTLKANGLHIVDTLLYSSTGFYANNKVLENPEKKAIIDYMVLMMRAVLLARHHMIAEFHITKDKLSHMLEILPSMKKPTVIKLHDESGEVFSIKVAVQKEVNKLIKMIKDAGGTDLIITKPKFVVL